MSIGPLSGDVAVEIYTHNTLIEKFLFHQEKLYTDSGKERQTFLEDIFNLNCLVLILTFNLILISLFFV